MRLSLKSPPPRPPPPKIVKRSRVLERSQRAYTIHDKLNRAFTLQLPIKEKNDGSLTKTTVVSFHNEHDARKFARMLEVHKAVNRDWPSTVFDDTFSLHLYTAAHSSIVDNDLCTIAWSYKDLTQYCVDNIMDIMHIKSMSETNEDISIKSDLIRLDMDYDFYVNKFTVMYSRV